MIEFFDAETSPILNRYITTLMVLRSLDINDLNKFVMSHTDQLHLLQQLLEIGSHIYDFNFFSQPNRRARLRKCHFNR